MLYTDYLKCKRDYQELGHVFLLTRKTRLPILQTRQG